jgi:hypothetical protein
LRADTFLTAGFCPAAREFFSGREFFNAPLLTTPPFVGIIANMSTKLITRFKDITADGAILELVVWKVSAPVPPTEHGYKYRAAYVVDGVRVVGFDNERGKGDHCHLDGVEVPYTFTGTDQLIEDFIAAVAARRAP